VHTITHEPLHLAWWNFAWACTLTTTQNPENFKVIGKRSRSQDQIFGFFIIVRQGKKFVKAITHEPLHLNWWNFARTCTSTTSRTLLNFKVIGQRSRSHWCFAFFCVHDAAATRGQCLALSKAWWSCYRCNCWILCYILLNTEKDVLVVIQSPSPVEKYDKYPSLM